MNSLEIIAIMYRGELPESLDVKTQYVLELLNMEHSISSCQALLITSARRDNFTDDKDWAAWCEEKFNLNGPYRCHMGQAGRLLLDVMDNIELFQELFKLEIYKLISLERLDRLDLNDFMNANDVTTMTRDAVRESVNNWLGQANPNKKMPINTAKYHPDLFDLIGGVCAIGVESVIKSITDTQKADQACDSGLKLYACSLEYYKANPGTITPERVKAFEKALQDDLKTLNAIGRGFSVTKAI